MKNSAFNLYINYKKDNVALCLQEEYYNFDEKTLMKCLRLIKISKLEHVALFLSSVPKISRSNVLTFGCTFIKLQISIALNRTSPPKACTV